MQKNYHFRKKGECDGRLLGSAAVEENGRKRCHGGQRTKINTSEKTNRAGKQRDTNAKGGRMSAGEKKKKSLCHKPGKGFSSEKRTREKA